MRRTVAVSLLAVALIIVLAVPSSEGGHGAGATTATGTLAATVSTGPPDFAGTQVFTGNPDSTAIFMVTASSLPAPRSGGVRGGIARLTTISAGCRTVGAGHHREQPPQSYWYYRPSAKAYYPTAPTCPEVWIKVPPLAQ